MSVVERLMAKNAALRAEVERLKGVLEANRLLSVQEVEQRHRANQAEAALARVRAALEYAESLFDQLGHDGAAERMRAALEGQG